VFGGNHFGICPTINLHGVGFHVVLPPARRESTSLSLAVGV
jgi:hypothetical protein